MMFADGFLELCDSDVRIKAHPETLQEAACIVRDELLKKETCTMALWQVF